MAGAGRFVLACMLGAGAVGLAWPGLVCTRPAARRSSASGSGSPEAWYRGCWHVNDIGRIEANYK